MGKYKINVGDKYGRLTILKQLENKNGRRVVKCRCECGKIRDFQFSLLAVGHTKSCGCLKKDILKKRNEKYKKEGVRHGMRYTKFYRAWWGIKERCNNKKHTSYKNYGAMGISYNKRWDKFENFMEDMHQGYMQHSKIYGEENTTLDRIDNNKGYSKENCRWATWMAQQNNRTNNININFMGQVKTLTNWARYFKINASTLSIRLKRMTFAQAVIKAL